jgi:hypothetical protein
MYAPLSEILAHACIYSSSLFITAKAYLSDQGAFFDEQIKCSGRLRLICWFRKDEDVHWKA